MSDSGKIDQPAAPARRVRFLSTPPPATPSTSPSPRSTVRWIALGLLLVGLATILIGQHAMSAGERLRGFPWYVVGAIAVGLAAWLPASGRALPPAVERGFDRLASSRLVVPAFTLGAAACGLLTYRLAYGRALNDSVWDVAIAWLAGFACLAIVAARGVRLPNLDGLLTRSRVAAWPWPGLLAMIVVMAVAIGVRSWRLSDFSTVTTGDDWFYSIAARGFRDGTIHNPFRSHLFILPMDLTAAIRGWISRPFPDDVASYRLFSVLYGVATVLGVFLLGRRLLGTWYGIAGAAALACMSIHIWGSRITLINAFDAFVMVWALWFLDRTMTNRQRRDAIGCGVILGIGLYGYWGSRVFLLFVAVLMLLMLVTPGWRTQVREMIRLFAWIVLGFAVVGAPAFAYWAEQPSQFLSRANQVTGTVQPTLLDRAELVFRALVFPFYAKQGSDAASFYRQDPPFLGWSIAPFLAIGAVAWIAWFVIELRQRGRTPRRPALLLAAWVLTIVPISQTESMGSQRFFAVMPMWALAAGTGIVIAITAIQGILTRDRWLSVVLATLMMAALAGDAIHETFVVQPTMSFDLYASRSYDLGWRLHDDDGTLTLLQAGWPQISYVGAGAWQFLAPGFGGDRSPSFDTPFDTTANPAPVIQEHQILILDPNRAKETCAILAQNPTAFMAEGRTEHGVLLYVVFSQDATFGGMRKTVSPAGSLLVPVSRPAC
ncbi:MAG: glycosyltransferase family 39 protein [Thermomicrobiales bacterium]